MTGYGKGPAMSYGDFYKGKKRTPGSYDDEEETANTLPVKPKSKTPVVDNIGSKLRKEAMKRRLKKMKAGM